MNGWMGRGFRKDLALWIYFVYVYLMLIIMSRGPFNSVADDPNAAAMRAFLSRRRLGLVKLSQDVAKRVENKTGFTNYSAHVFDAAMYYNEGIKSFSELEASGAMDSMDLMTKRYMQHVLHLAARESAQSAFRAAHGYRSKNVRAFKWNKKVKALRAFLGL
jgi:hypothetical protein